MSFFKRFTRIFKRNYYKKKKILNKKCLQCRIKLLDDTFIEFQVDKISIGWDLINQVMIHLDIIERDYFSLKYIDKTGEIFWLDPMKKIVHQIKYKPTVYEFEFRVKFYALDPDQLNEELTRYHFYLQLRQDIIKNKLNLNSQMIIELSALGIQSELGDYDIDAHKEDYVKEAIFYKNIDPLLLAKIEAKHKDLIGYTPGECEINFLRLIKSNDLYGIELYSVVDEINANYGLGLSPRGVILLRGGYRIGFYPWNRVNMISFKKKNIRLYIHNRLDPNVIDKYNFETGSYKIAKSIWKSSIEHHSFFRLIRIVRNNNERKTYSNLFTSKFRYSGRTLYEACEDSSRLSKRKMSMKRTGTISQSQRTTVGYIRIGSRVFARADNGEYFKGIVIALSDKVYIKCDDGITLAHQKNTQDGIIYDSTPDPQEIYVGSRVIAYWPGISNYLPGNISNIDGSGNFCRYQIAFDDGDNHWNTIDQIRLLKPPMFFGPGSNSTYLQKKYSVIKTTTMVESQISPTIEMGKNSSNSTINEDIIKIHSNMDLQNSNISFDDEMVNCENNRVLPIPLMSTKL